MTIDDLNKKVDALMVSIRVKGLKDHEKAKLALEICKLLDERDLEILSSQFHDVYIKEAKRQGDCRHKDKYEDLEENIKEYDRVLARHVLKNYTRRGSNDF